MSGAFGGALGGGAGGAAIATSERVYRWSGDNHAGANDATTNLGANTITLPDAPADPNKVEVTMNGQDLYRGAKFTIAGNVITIVGVAIAAGDTGDVSCFV